MRPRRAELHRRGNQFRPAEGTTRWWDTMRAQRACVYSVLLSVSVGRRRSSRRTESAAPPTRPLGQGARSGTRGYQRKVVMCAASKAVLALTCSATVYDCRRQYSRLTLTTVGLSRYNTISCRFGAAGGGELDSTGRIEHILRAAAPVRVKTGEQVAANTSATPALAIAA
jgi:hypothetical protein